MNKKWWMTPILFLLCLASHSTLASLKATLFTPLAKTDQILFISSDDKVKYLKQSDEIVLHVNDKSKSLFKANSTSTQYQVFATSAHIKTVLLADSQALSSTGLRQNKNIFVTDFTNTEAEPLLMAKGDFPQLHLNDAWLSFIDWEKHNLNLLFLPFTQKASFQLKITHPNNPFFIPSRTMIGQESFFYTDGSKSGKPSVIFFNLKTKKFRLIYQSQNASETLNLCHLKENLYLAAWDSAEGGSGRIWEITGWSGKTLPQKKEVYASALPHRGALACDSHFNTLSYLRWASSSQKGNFTVVQLTPSTKKVEVLADQYSFGSLFYMDMRLMASEGGKYYVVSP